MTASQILGNFCWQNCHLFQVLAGQWFPDKHISRTLSRDLLLNWVACDQKMLPFLGFRASFRVSQKSSFSLWERWVFQFGLENVSRKHYYWLLWWAEQLPLLPNSTHRHYREPCVTCVVIIIGKKAITKLWIEKLLEDNFIEKSIVYWVSFMLGHTILIGQLRVSQLYLEC